MTKKTKKKAKKEPRTPPANEVITLCGQCYYLGTYPDGTLHCRRMCPTSGVAPEPKAGTVFASWPKVNANDWCAWGYSLATGKWNTPSGNEPQS